MKEIFQIIGAVLFSIGGGGTIIFALSSWLGKVWAARILENQKKEHLLEIEEYKSKLNSELNKVNSRNEKALYISKVQYDKEFSIYLDIWEKFYDCIMATLKLYPIFEDIPTDNSEREKYMDTKYSSYIEKFNLYSRTIDRYAPFYKEDFYKDFVAVRSHCSKMGNIFKLYNYDVKYNASFSMARDTTMTIEEHRDVYTNIPKFIEEKRSLLQKEIREYLLNLQVI